MIFDIDTNELFRVIGELYVEKNKLEQALLASNVEIMELRAKVGEFDNDNSKIPADN